MPQSQLHWQRITTSDAQRLGNHGGLNRASSSIPTSARITANWSDELHWAQDQIDRVVALQLLKKTWGVIAAVERFADWEQELHRFQKSCKPKIASSNVILLLGTWWSGHGRTMPFSDEAEFETIYWHEILDRMIPLLYELDSGSDANSKLNGLTLVVSSNAHFGRMWLDMLGHSDSADDRPSSKTESDADSEKVENCNLQPLVIRQVQALPECNPQWVFLDGDDAIVDRESIERIRKSYPRGIILAFYAFPRWEIANQAVAAGVDWVLGKPFNWLGLRQAMGFLASFSSAFSSAALPRK